LLSWARQATHISEIFIQKPEIFFAVDTFWTHGLETALDFLVNYLKKWRARRDLNPQPPDP
jgi:hypothetical protein